MKSQVLMLYHYQAGLYFILLGTWLTFLGGKWSKMTIYDCSAIIVWNPHLKSPIKVRESKRKMGEKKNIVLLEIWPFPVGKFCCIKSTFFFDILQLLSVFAIFWVFFGLFLGRYQVFSIELRLPSSIGVNLQYILSVSIFGHF